MNDHQKGWIIRVTTKHGGAEPPSVQIYDVAILDLADAVEAVRRACGAGRGTIVETIGELPAGTDLYLGVTELPPTNPC
jgi:hypothetical protein